MILLIVDGVVVINYSDIKRSNANIDFLTSHTFNTWQKNRGVAEKKDDTSLGKLAEDAVSTVLRALGIESYYLR